MEKMDNHEIASRGEKYRKEETNYNLPEVDMYCKFIMEFIPQTGPVLPSSLPCLGSGQIALLQQVCKNFTWAVDFA